MQLDVDQSSRQTPPRSSKPAPTYHCQGATRPRPTRAPLPRVELGGSGADAQRARLPTSVSRPRLELIGTRTESLECYTHVVDKDGATGPTSYLSPLSRPRAHDWRHGAPPVPSRALGTPLPFLRPTRILQGSHPPAGEPSTVDARLTRSHPPVPTKTERRRLWYECRLNLYHYSSPCQHTESAIMQVE